DIDEGDPYRLVIALTDGDKGDVSMRGELRRGAEILPLPALSVLFRAGIAFMGTRAIRVDGDAAFGWVAVLRREERLDGPADETEELVRGLIATCGKRTLELPSSFVIEKDSRPFVTRIRLRTPDERWRMNAGPLLADLTFDYDGARAGWRDHGDF